MKVILVLLILASDPHTGQFVYKIGYAKHPSEEVCQANLSSIMQKPTAEKSGMIGKCVTEEELADILGKKAP